MDVVQLGREDFLDEIRVAPKWNLYHFKYYGFFELVVFYHAKMYIYHSPYITDMTESESKYFYRTLEELMNTPSIMEAKVE